MMPALNVRCSREPEKILGTLEVTSREPEQPVRHLDETESMIELRDFCFFRLFEPCYEPAVYSGDRPIEFWRTVHGFKEKVL